MRWDEGAVRVVVVGGTGTVGRHVVAALRVGGHEPVVASRSTGVDVVTGAGLDSALEGAAAVVDASSTLTTRRRAAVAFFTRATDNLLAAEARAGVSHHVVVSIVGVDRVPLGYYQGKLAQERAALAGRVPVSVLRTTQFHEFADQVLDRTSLGRVALVPPMTVQPVAASEVGAALAALAVGDPVGRAVPMAGPEVHQLVDLARRVAAARGSRTRVVRVPLPGRTWRLLAGGALLPTGQVHLGRVPFDEWLRASA